ncbi:uncharacterized protein LOC124155784 [Ischnura elegans]|uniref:uncharacterized protein LOC124155784 n=1 Tax=Ischnura elegans TaxID=197161 RepID=UPI001ED898BC|nr:uncharacterized protein LOC124155784 [Ischnura elegans]
MMRAEDKWSLVESSHTRHGGRKKRRGRGYLATRKAAVYRPRGGVVSPLQSHGIRHHQGPSADGDGRVGGSTQTGTTPGTCGGRVLRSRRYRRPFEDKPIKRLFTPEIKRFLKGWLVRRRENPYPSREEKKELSRQTALTYVQICNWFANWRRKLKNAAEESAQQAGGDRADDDDLDDDREDSGREDGSGVGGDEGPERGRGGRGRTWGNLIRSYNSRAHGNVEQFSITSDDSIWEESVDVEDFGDHQPGVGLRSTQGEPLSGEEGEGSGCQEDWPTMEHSYSILLDRPRGAVRQQQRIQQTTGRKQGDHREAGRRTFGQRQGFLGARKGSCEVTSSSSSSSSASSDSEGVAAAAEGGGGRRMAFVVARGDKRHRHHHQPVAAATPSSQVSKWLESAYAFDERKMNFSSVVDAGGTSVQLKWAARNVTWPTGDTRSAAERTSWMLSRVGRDDSCRWSVAGRHKEELDAAEALARLSTTASP